ncbi:MAG: chloride channel protein [Ignavibacteriaceae bacterium]|nr:MAG: chloride channel protein [Ignavibacteriaceae bacterium]
MPRANLGGNPEKVSIATNRQKAGFRRKLIATLKYQALRIPVGSFNLDLTQDGYTLILGAVTGVLCGFGAVIFHHSIELISYLFYYLPPELFPGFITFYPDTVIGVIYVILIPATGGLTVGLIAHFFENGKKGEGIPNVILAVATKGGIMKGSVAVLKTIQNAISIGTGGAGGKEGPIVQIGAAIGSWFGQKLNLSSDRLKILVGCGAAAGLSAAFNAPLGGAIFTMEIILRTFNSRSLGPIIVSSVFATVISRGYIGDEPAFQIPMYELKSYNEFYIYIVLGILAGLIAIYFVKVMFYFDEFFNKIKLPGWFKPAVGGLMVGVIGLMMPGIYGFTQQSVDKSLYNQNTLTILILMFSLKPLATALTIGSGGYGGTFAPSLFTGAMLGGAVGQVANMLFPEIAAPAGAYALVGMGAVAAGTTHASLTALIMVFEMTNNYRIILPLMLTIIISTLISRAILKGSLYTIRLGQEGVGIDIYGRKTSLLKSMKISTLIESNNEFILESDNYHKTLEILRNSSYETLLVKSADGEVKGVISYQNLRKLMFDKETASIADFLIAGDLMKRRFAKINEDEDADTALKIMETIDMEYLPVYDYDDVFKGIVSKQKILRVYHNELFLAERDQDMSS